MGERRTKHIAYLDAARGLALCAVVFYHAGPPGVAKDVLLTYAIGLFFTISGFLYRDEYSIAPFKYIIRRLRRLWVPYVAWGLVYLALHNLFLSVGLYSELVGFQGRPNIYYGVSDFLGMAARTLAFRHTEQMGGALWFLPLLFLAEVAFVLLSWGVSRIPMPYKEWIRFAGVLALCAVGYLEVPRALPAGGSPALVAVLPLYLGFSLRRVEERVRWRWYWLFGCLAVMVWLGPAVNFGANRYAGPWQLVAATACGAYVTFYAAKQLESSKLLSYVGRNTIFIVATHFLAFKIVSAVLTRLYHLPRSQMALVAISVDSWWVAYGVVGLAVPVLAGMAWDRALAAAASVTVRARAS